MSSLTCYSHANYVIKNLANLLPPTEHVTTMSKSNVTIAPIQVSVLFNP